MFYSSAATRKAGENVNVVERERRFELARKLRAAMENQRLLMETLSLAAQQIWSDDELRSRCDALLREVARESVKTGRQWMDITREYDQAEAPATDKGEGGRDETLSW